MARIPINIGGGASATSDDCTATAADVLESKTAIYDGSDDEAEYGSMKDYSGTTSAGTSSLDSGNSRVQLAIPNTGKYDTNSKLYQSYSNIASLIGLTAAKIGTGNSILGVSGTYTGVGTATASQVLSGYTFSNASGSGLSGSMTDKSGSTTSATSSLDSSNSRVRLQIPNNGYYNTSAYLYQSYSNIASLIGLTAAKVVSGNTILGISGSASQYASASSGSSGYSMYPASMSSSSWTLTSLSGSDSSADFKTLTMSILGLSSLSFTPTVMMIFTNEGIGALYDSSACYMAGGNGVSKSGIVYASKNSAYSLTKSSINVPLYIVKSYSSSNTLLVRYYIIGTT